MLWHLPKSQNDRETKRCVTPVRGVTTKMINCCAWDYFVGKSGICQPVNKALEGPKSFFGMVLSHLPGLIVCIVVGVGAFGLQVFASTLHPNVAPEQRVTRWNAPGRVPTPSVAAPASRWTWRLLGIENGQ